MLFQFIFVIYIVYRIKSYDKILQLALLYYIVLFHFNWSTLIILWNVKKYWSYSVIYFLLVSPFLQN